MLYKLTVYTRLFKSAISNTSSIRSMSVAEAPAGDKLTLTLASPYNYYYKGSTVDQVNICAASGDMGVLAKHVPTIQQLRPGVIEIISNSQSKKLFCSGGFAVIAPDSSVNISTSELFPLDNFDPQATQKGLALATKLSQEAPDEKTKIEASIALEVYQALTTALSSAK